MTHSNRDKKDSAGTSSSREESGSENQGDGFETGNTRQGGMSGAGSGDSGSTGLGGETSEGSTSRPGGVEGTSTRDGREDPDRGSRR